MIWPISFSIKLPPHYIASYKKYQAYISPAKWRRGQGGPQFCPYSFTTLKFHQYYHCCRQVQKLVVKWKISLFTDWHHSLLDCVRLSEKSLGAVKSDGKKSWMIIYFREFTMSLNDLRNAKITIFLHSFRTSLMPLKDIYICLGPAHFLLSVLLKLFPEVLHWQG